MPPWLSCWVEWSTGPAADVQSDIRGAARVQVGQGPGGVGLGWVGQRRALTRVSPRSRRSARSTAVWGRAASSPAIMTNESVCRIGCRHKRYPREDLMGVTVIGVGLMGRGIGTRLGTMSAEARAESSPGTVVGAPPRPRRTRGLAARSWRSRCSPDLLIAGDDERAKGQVAELARGGGLESVRRGAAAPSAPARTGRLPTHHSSGPSGDRRSRRGEIPVVSDRVPPRDPEELEAEGAPAQAELPASTRVGAVHLTVADLEAVA